jgi:hypothetical protein
VPDLLIDLPPTRCSAASMAAPSTSASRAHAHGGEREPSDVLLDVHQYPPPDQHAEVAFSTNVPDLLIDHYAARLVLSTWWRT